MDWRLPGREGCRPVAAVHSRTRDGAPDLPAGVHVRPEGMDLRLLGIAQVR